MFLRSANRRWKRRLTLFGLLLWSMAAPGCGGSPAPPPPAPPPAAVREPVSFPTPAPFATPEDWSFRVEFYRPPQPTPTFVQFMPLVFEAKPDDRLIMTFRKPPGQDAAVEMHLLLNGTQLPERPDPEAWRASVDQRELAPEVHEVLTIEDEFWRLTWPLPSGAKTFSLTLPRTDRLLLSVKNIPWDWRQNGCPESAFCFDYFLGGGYLTTIPSAFECCTRAGDFLVLHQTKDRFVDPVLAARIIKYNSLIPQPNRNRYFIATVDGRELAPTIRELAPASGGELEFTWELRPEWETVRLDQQVLARFQVTLAEKSPDWPAIDRFVHQPGTGEAVPPTITRRVETNPNQPCFP